MATPKKGACVGPPLPALTAESLRQPLAAPTDGYAVALALRVPPMNLPVSQITSSGTALKIDE